MNKHYVTRNWLVFCLMIETICVTYALKIPIIIPTATILYFLSGIVISLLMVGLPSVKLTHDSFMDLVKEKTGYKLLIVLGMAIAIWYFTRASITANPLSFYDADMLPIINTMCKRFLNGEWSMVYQPIPEVWNGIQPIYLPAMWIPFVFAVEGNFDLRWITAAGLFFSFSFFLVLWKPVQKKIAGYTLLIAAAIILWWLLTEPSHDFIRLTEEGVVVFYYCLLTLALLSENYVLIGLAAALCALSRYMIAGWFPAMIIYLWLIRKQPKQLFLFLITGACVLLLLVILPFGWKPIKISVDLPVQYIAHATRVWKDNPQLFFESMGFAKFFGPAGTYYLHRVLLLTAFIIPVSFILGCFALEKWKKKKLANIPLACLKITIVTVCTFIDVPYQYLFYTSSFISLLMITAVLSQKQPVPGSLANQV